MPAVPGLLFWILDSGYRILFVKIVIIGYGPAAVSALAAINSCRKGNGTSATANNRQLDIAVITPERHLPYSPMFLVEYALGDTGKKQLYLPPPSKATPFKTITGRKVVAIRTSENAVQLDNGETVPYDQLLVATGASALKPPIAGLTKPGVLFVNRLDDALRLRERAKRASNIVVVGAGAIGIETALALATLGKRVTVVEALGQILPLMLDPDFASCVQKKLESMGIAFSLNSRVCEVPGKRHAEGVVCEAPIPADMVVVAVGFKPNLDFTNPQEIKTGRGLQVNERMQTSVPNIYAAGDVAESRNPFADRYELNFTWYSAIEQGQAAGCNMMGAERKLLYSPSLNVMKGLPFTVGSVGQKVQGKDYRVLSFSDERAGIMERIYLRGNFIEHYQSIGLPYKLGYIFNLVKARKNVSHILPFLFIKDGNPAFVV